MIGAFVDYALNNRFIVVVVAVLLLACGAIAFHSLPVEAYPDVANNYVQVITQWPGHAAEEIEQQVTIPVEIQMNGIPHLQHLRSVSIFGLSSVMLIFDDQSINDWNRKRCWKDWRKSSCRTACSRKWAPTGAPLARSTSTI